MATSLALPSLPEPSAPHFLDSTDILASAVSDVSDTETYYEVCENPTEAVHLDAPVQEASQPKASSDKKKKSKKSKAPKQVPGMIASPAREVLGVRNVITEPQDIFNV